MLGAGFGSGREGEGQMQRPMRRNHPLPLQYSVEPVGRYTALPLSECLAEKNITNNGDKDAMFFGKLNQA